jgi:hypothetical protein
MRKKMRNYWKREPLIIIKVEPSCLGCNSKTTLKKFYFMSCCAAGDVSPFSSPIPNIYHHHFSARKYTKREHEKIANPKKKLVLTFFLCLNNSKNKNLSKSHIFCVKAQKSHSHTIVDSRKTFSRSLWNT